MFAGALFGKVPNVIADKLVIVTISVPGSGDPGETVLNLLPPGTFDSRFVVAGARIVASDAVKYGTDPSGINKNVDVDVSYNPPVADWISDTYIRAQGAGATTAVVELFLSKVAQQPIGS